MAVDLEDFFMLRQGVEMNIAGVSWYALYVKSRHEFVSLSELSQKGIETFLPSIKKPRQWKDRKKIVEFPLFPGYLFVRVQPSPEKLLNVLKTRGVVTFISLSSGNPSTVPDEEMDSLKLLVESGEELDIYPHLKEGTEVVVKRGPLKGAHGILIRRAEQYMFLINIKLLGKSVGVKVYEDDLEAA
jgi:transcriptional antiterminator NusG